MPLYRTVNGLRRGVCTFHPLTDQQVASGLGALLGVCPTTSAKDTFSQDEQLHQIYVALLNDSSRLSQLNDAH